MSFFRHPEIYRPMWFSCWPSLGATTAAAPTHRLDEFPAGYSSASCSPAEPASASPAGHQYPVMSSCRSSSFHRTANCVLTICPSSGGHRKTGRLPELLQPPSDAFSPCRSYAAGEIRAAGRCESRLLSMATTLWRFISNALCRLRPHFQTSRARRS
jgi:hypothetical protein